MDVVIPMGAATRALLARVVAVAVLAAVVDPACVALLGGEDAGGRSRTEHFDVDPMWLGVNNRLAATADAVTIRQDFGFSRSKHAGGGLGELGGRITPAGEAAYYARVLEPKSFETPLAASGTFACPDGAYHILLGYFNAGTTREWRTPNTIALRLNGRGDHFYAYVEYCTARWRAGGDTTPFPSAIDPTSGRQNLIGFASGGKVYRWTLRYDPNGNDGRGTVEATIGEKTAVCILDEGHRGDGAVFDRFGMLNIVKSADTGGEVWFDDITVDGETETFDEDPRWDARNNRRSYPTTIVRPRCNVGHSPTHFAGGLAAGELGGTIFRGDCRYPGSMAALGDAIGPLTLDRPFRAEGKVAMTRGVSDSTTCFGFYSSRDSLRQSDSQRDAIPESVAGVHIEGPSREGFFVYPVARSRGGQGVSARPEDSPRIHPDSAHHHWTLEYDPAGAGGAGRITVTLDGQPVTLDLDATFRASGTQFDRFGIVTSWIDGNSQDVYWDDLTYTVSQ